MFSKAKLTNEKLPLSSNDQDIDDNYMETEGSEGSDSSIDEDEDIMVITNKEVCNYKLYELNLCPDFEFQLADSLLSKTAQG